MQKRSIVDVRLGSKYASFPPNILKISIDATANILQNISNEIMIKAESPDSLKLSNMIPILLRKIRKIAN